jgi:hypothetical protein
MFQRYSISEPGQYAVYDMSSWKELKDAGWEFIQ